jgi:hypothetical protein
MQITRLANGARSLEPLVSEALHRLTRVPQVEELGPLELCQAAVQRRLRALGNGPQEGQRYLHTNDRSNLEEVFGLGG